MARPLRIEFPGALYHVTTRGDRREPIFVDDEDRATLLAVLGRAMAHFDARAFAWCLMGNHYHLVLQTAQPNLSQLMRQVNGVYTQRFNARHDKVGHLFQGRYTALLVDRQPYLLQVCRYVDLNPVRAGLVPHPQDWGWSSYRANAGLTPPLPWMDLHGLWAHVRAAPVIEAVDAADGAARYRNWVAAGHAVRLWDGALRQQIYLGDDEFIAGMRARAELLAQPDQTGQAEVPKAQRASPLTLQQWLARCPSRDEAIVQAHRQSLMTMTAIARALGLSVSRVSRIVAAAEADPAPCAAGDAAFGGVPDRMAKGKT